MKPLVNQLQRKTTECCYYVRKQFLNTGEHDFILLIRNTGPCDKNTYVFVNHREDKKSVSLGAELILTSLNWFKFSSPRTRELNHFG